MVSITLPTKYILGYKNPLETWKGSVLSNGNMLNAIIHCQFDHAQGMVAL